MNLKKSTHACAEPRIMEETFEELQIINGIQDFSSST
jgi:hypothetical protein